MQTTEATAAARAFGFDPGVLGITIFPTEKCNFRCTYCYETFPNSRLEDDTATSIMQLISHRACDLHVLSIGWFGGEPLLERSRVLQISSYAHHIASVHGFAFSSHITTNGSLLDFDLFEQLLASGVCRFQISLDGMEEDHNQTRRSGTANGTFSPIMRNLLSMRRSTKTFAVTLRLHVHASNVGSLIRLIDFIATKFRDDGRFTVNVQKIINHGGKRQNPIQLASREALKIVQEHLVSCMPLTQIVSAADVLQCCYASMPNHFVIRANGRIQKCTVALYDDRNDVGELQSNGTIEWISQEKLRLWSAGLFEGDLEKMICPWRVMKRSAPLKCV